MPQRGHAQRFAHIAAAAAGLAALAGCTGVAYDSDPARPATGEGLEPSSATYTVQNLMAASLDWAVDRHPPPPGSGRDAGWFAINLPRGLTREQYINVAEMVGDRAAPITPELEHLPTYHVGWVWMRGDEGRVDVFRPVYALSTGEQEIHQAITLYLHRRFNSWRVERTQPWEPGVVQLPPLYYLPEAEAGVESEAPPEPGGAPDQGNP